MIQPISVEPLQMIHNTTLGQEKYSRIDSLWRTYIINASSIPSLIGKRVDSLSVKLFNGTRWFNGNIWIWNGTKEIVTPFGTVIKVPKRGLYITKQCQIIIKIPTYIKTKYTKDWPIDIALNHIHNRIYVLLPADMGATIGVYIFYDKKYSMHRYPFIPLSKYIELKKSSLLVSPRDILGIVEEKVSSFIVSRDLRIIDYNVSLSEYEKKYSILSDPPWYIDDGGGGDTNPPPPPEDEYWFVIPVVDKEETVNSASYSAYLGIKVNNLYMYMYIENPNQELANINMKVSLIDNNTGSTLKYEYYYYHINGEESLEINEEFPMDYTLYSSYYCTLKIELDVTNGNGQPLNVNVSQIFLIVTKDFNGPGIIKPADEIGIHIIGYQFDNNERSSPWKKALGTDMGSNETLILSGTVNGLYAYGDPNDPYKYGFYAIINYYVEQEYIMNFKLNGVTFKTIILEPTGSSSSVVLVQVSFDDIRQLIINGISSLEGISLSIETNALRDPNAEIEFTAIALELPIYPDVWRPKSDSFTRLHRVVESSSLVYNYGSRSTGLVSYTFSSKRYNQTRSGYPIDDIRLQYDIIVSGAEYYDPYDMVSYFRFINVTIAIPIDSFNIIGTTLDRNVYISDQVNGELKEFILFAKEAYYLAEGVYLAITVISGTSNPIIGGTFYVIGLLLDILSVSESPTFQEDWKDINGYRYIWIAWNAGLQPIRYGRYRFWTVPMGFIGNATIKGSVEVAFASDTYEPMGTCYSYFNNAVIFTGKALHPQEPYTIHGKRWLRD